MKKEELLRILEESYSKEIVNAFKAIKRENFVLDKDKDIAYEDEALAIGYGATISQPSTIAFMLKLLEIKEGMKILEIGAGSGYNSALISRLVGPKGRIYTLDILPELVEFARKNLKKEMIGNVKVILWDGSLGYSKEKPYNRIIVTAACASVPEKLLEQLKINGILLAPVGEYEQEIVKIIKRKNRLERESFGYFRFVPLRRT